MSEICEMCGSIWGGATIGKLWHCRSVKPVKPKAKKREIVQVKNERMCECGSVAMIDSPLEPSSKICQRCRDCESAGYSLTHRDGLYGKSYSVNLPTIDPNQ